MFRVLVPVDGSASSLRAVQFVLKKAPLYREPLALHLLNVQRPFPGTIQGVRDQAERHHHDEGLKALASARNALETAGVKYVHHISIGEAAEAIAQFARENKIEQIIMGTRGLGAIASMLVGSVASKVLRLVDVPVMLVK
jgi:nucleotide-binding universal stress UspA family protein